MKRKRARQEPPPALLVGTISHEELTAEPVYLDHRGRLTCGNYVFKDDRSHTFRGYYRACMEYLSRKARKPDMSAFREKSLMDVINDLNARRRNSISKAELIEIAGPYNQAAMMREMAMKRARRLVNRTYWRRRRKTWRPPWEDSGSSNSQP